MYIIDFGADTPASEAALYEAPFEYVSRVVKPIRDVNRRPGRAMRWWIHSEAAPALRKAISNLRRYIATPITAKHRLFVWLDPDVLPNNTISVIARDDDFTMGILHSKVHERWARGTGTQLREVESAFRYTPTTTFETFPFPRPSDEQHERVGEAARRLVELRDGWLNPPGLESSELEKRTLTNLYNQRPTWLANAHADLDAAVLASYGWPTETEDVDLLANLLTLNLQRAGAPSPANEPAAVQA